MYYVYENWRAQDKTVVHNAKCSFCKNGEGLTTGSGSNGKWHGPFTSVQIAVNYANKLGRVYNSLCKKCNP